MKKIMNKNTILGLVIGIVISGITVYAVSYNANEIDFTPTNKDWNVSKVDKALDDLYKNKDSGKTILWVNEILYGDPNAYNFVNLKTSSQRLFKIDNDYFEINNSGEVIAKKNFKIKISHYINPTQNLQYTAKIKTVKNSNIVLETTGGTSIAAFIHEESNVIELQKDDKLLLYAQGGYSDCTAYSWMIEVAS